MSFFPFTKANNVMAFVKRPIKGEEVLSVMTCFECECGELLPATVRLEGARGGETFNIETSGLKCNHCGFETVDSEQSAEFTRQVSDEYRTRHGLLTGVEIRAVRTQRGMTQQQFADFLGTGVASIKRWESGQVQDKAMDELIRLKTDIQIATQNLRSIESQLFAGNAISTFGISGDVELELLSGEICAYDRPPAMHQEPMTFKQPIDRPDEQQLAA